MTRASINIKGLVERLELSQAKAMMPLFEAISNAIDAIQELNDGFQNHSVLIRLISTNDLVYQSGDNSFIVDGFDVIDDGVGFNNENVMSFREAYTLSKVKLGGKGVGRFTFLKVFSSVKIKSVFMENNINYLREFNFSIQHDFQGIDEIKQTDQKIGTKVSLRLMAEKYKKGWPQDPKIIAEKIIAHFLIRFASRSCPQIVLEAAGHETINLNKLFDLTIINHIQEQIFEVKKQVFSLQVYRNRDGRTRHTIHLCANGREVVSGKLRDLLPELPDKFLDNNQEPYTLIILITGEYLDENTNQERTHIVFQSDNEFDYEEELISKQDLYNKITKTLRPLLADDLKSTNEEKLLKIEEFVIEAPEYRILTHPRYKEKLEQKIQPGLSDEKLDEALLHVKREIEDEVKKETRHIAALFETETFEQYQEKFKELAERTNEIGKAQLAVYIAHRRTILDLVDSSLKKKRSDDKYPLEKVLHKMIFPMGVTSKDIFFEQQNLWLIDERLCYHTILTSDKKLKSISGLEYTSLKEPDIFAFFYDTPIGVSEPNNLHGGGVVIIEFKRPGRDDYDKDPADQIIQRFREISEGNVQDIDGRMVNPQNLRYTGYLIADLTPSLRNQVFGRYHKTADNEGYFYNLAEGNGNIEIVSYDKLVKDALRRNRMLFDKLGLHKD
ncbi:ATP-binding protein [Pelistega sp. NLN82]|uniref:ATP-binding protein n=1 Tax=Pelistega ratti TaxID=2652177 RepID=A0A6L9Y601_9BURK|nr:ATP-binding protein [Pelistega ratti]NEN75920.1 ATP-binding protein [Pelistega ratti]